MSETKVNDLSIRVGAHLSTPRKGMPLGDDVITDGRLEDTESNDHHMRVGIRKRPKLMTREEALVEFFLFQGLIYKPRRIAERWMENLRRGAQHAFALLGTELVYAASADVIDRMYPEIAQKARDREKAMPRERRIHQTAA